MSDSKNDRILINTEIEARGKKAVVAYLLWFFLGTFGGHRFYLGKTGTGVAQLALAVVGYATAVILVGFIFLFIVWAWMLIDVFLIGGMIREDHQRIEQNIRATL